MFSGEQLPWIPAACQWWVSARLRDASSLSPSLEGATLKLLSLLQRWLSDSTTSPCSRRTSVPGGRPGSGGRACTPTTRRWRDWSGGRCCGGPWLTGNTVSFAFLRAVLQLNQDSESLAACKTVRRYVGNGYPAVSDSPDLWSAFLKKNLFHSGNTHTKECV